MQRVKPAFSFRILNISQGSSKLKRTTQTFKNPASETTKLHAKL